MKRLGTAKQWGVVFLLLVALLVEWVEVRIGRVVEWWHGALP